MQRIRILNSKLLIPHTSDTIKRDRLFTLLAEIPGRRITTVIAGAGFGKTTLVAATVSHLYLNTVWYRLDKSDSDFLPFLSYLIAGISKHSNDMGVETHQRIEEAWNLNNEREAVLAVFLSEIQEHVKNDIIIVLDDYHLVQDSEEINECMRFIIENMPPQVHLVIISRTDPIFPLSLYRARREVLDVNEDELCFTIPEIEELYFKLFGISLQNTSLQELHKKTDGWVSGLILFYHSLRGKSEEEIEIILSKFKGSHGIISEYLEENIFSSQTDEIKEFLIKTSILSRLNVGLCNRLLGIDSSRDILWELEDNHLFTFSFDEERAWYYYHTLFQEFLYKKLTNELGREVILNLHKNAAILWEEQDEDEEALRHYLLAEEFRTAYVLLRKLITGLLNEGRVHMINSYLKKIPDSFLNKEPWIQYTQALTLELSYNPREAISAFERAHNIFQESGPPDGVILCLTNLGYNYYIDGDFQNAEIKLKELLYQVRDNHLLCVDILGHLIFISSHLGKFSVADRYFKKAMTLLAQAKDNKLLAWLYLNQISRCINSGDFSQALKLGEQTKGICEEQGFYRFVVLCYYLISYSCFFLGHFSRGMENAGKGLDIVTERGLWGELSVRLLLCMSLNSAGLGKITEAIYYGREFIAICRAAKSRWTEAWGYYALNIAYLKSGNLLIAEDCARFGIDLIKDLNLPLEEGTLKLSLARSLIEMEQFDKVLPSLEEAEKFLKMSKFGSSGAHILFTQYFHKNNQKESALNRLFSALQLCEANHYEVWITFEKHWIIPLLLELFALGKMQDYIQNIFQMMGQSAKEKLAQLRNDNDSQIRKAASVILNKIDKAPPSGLRVFCLGKFRVFHGDDEIPSEMWKSKQAKMLFQYLIYYRSRGYIPKDVLMELLWPEEDPEKTSHRLQVALSSLRKILEPDIRKGIPSSYLLRDRNSYKLFPGNDGWIDIEEFNQELKSAKEEKDIEKSITYLKNAEVLYKGNFLAEIEYVDWCVEERERIKEEYLDLLTKLMEYFGKKNDSSRCIIYARKYLEVDKYAEKIYQQLMKYYFKTGEEEMIAATFEQCKKNIMIELAVPLSEATNSLFFELISSYTDSGSGKS